MKGIIELEDYDQSSLIQNSAIYSDGGSLLFVHKN